jgi:laminin alpha 3/5
MLLIFPIFLNYFLKQQGEYTQRDVNFKNPQKDEMFLVVHYYQPNHPSVPVEVRLDKEPGIVGVLNASYCPSLTGCRAVVEFNNGDVREDINAINLKLTDREKNVWLDQVALLWAVDPEKLNFEPVSHNEEFKDQCVPQNTFYIEHYTSLFCDESVLSISATYHHDNAALSCDCDKLGASNPEFCESFGGQCQCNEHIIGRTCSRCRVGYFDFPNCRKCDCTSTTCDSRTGECTDPICSNNGVCLEKCHSFHPIYGCNPCKGENSPGVLEGQNGVCNITNGGWKCVF